MIRFFYGFVALLIIFMLINFVPEYMSNHQYYYGFLSDLSNFKILLSVIACSLIPLGVLFLEKRNIWVSMGLYLLGFFIFSTLFLNIQSRGESLLSQGGFFGLIANFGLVSILAFHFIFSIWGAGDIILKYFFRREMVDGQDYAFSFGVGLITFLSIVYILLLTGLLTPISSLIIFFVGTFCIYKSNIISKAHILVNRFSFSNYPSMISKIGIFLALILVIGYLYLGWIYAYIPYPTAWDANHAYMFFPKAWSLNNGIYWDQNIWTPPYMWYSYISYWFSLANIIKINPDTLAVFMNNLSGLFVIIFFTSLISSVFNMVGMSKQTKILGTIFGLIGLMVWLTSGMGAFLVFVDNKTDLGVLTLILLALVSGIYLVQKINLENYDKINWYAVLSGIFFGFASLAKPTAMIDAMAFAILLNIMLFGLSGGFGIAIGSLGILSISKVMGIDAYISSSQGMIMILIGGILFLSQFFGKQNIKRFNLFLIWGISFVATLAIFKLPYIIGYNLINNKTPGISEVVRGVMMGKGNNFLAKNIEIGGLRLADTSTPTNLYEGLKPLTGSAFSEDVGRYVGYGNKDFSTKFGGLPFQKSNTEDFQYINLCMLFEETPGSLALGLDEKINNLPNKEFNTLLTNFSDDFKKNISSGKFLSGNNYTEFYPELKNKCEKVLYNKTYYKLCYDFITGSKNGFSHQNSNYLNALPSGKLKNLFSSFFNSKGFVQDSNYIYSFNPSDPSLASIKSLCSESMQGTAKDICDQFNAGKIQNSLEFKQLLSQNQQASSIFLPLLNSTGFVLASDQTYKYGLDEYKSLANECKYVLSSLENKTSPYTTYSLPYKRIIPFNVSFNWSLQNLSSYYTDIGFVWIIMLIVNIIGLIYSSIKKEKFLSALLLSSLFAWVIWFFIGGGILWYGIGLPVWTLLSFSVFMFRLKDDFQKTFDDNVYSRYLSYGLVVLCLIFIGYQLVLNYSRMATYQLSGPFLWFKTGVGKIQDGYKYVSGEGIKEIEGSEAIKIPYTSNDIFQLQFPHYNKLLQLVNNRNVETEGVFLAGTYARYFFSNQKNVIYDQFLESMWQWFSDNDVSKSWLRLIDKKIKYIAIDPNIGTVVQGDGNTSLFDRFYGSLDNKKNIAQNGALSMIANLVEEGKVKLVYTNNLFIKYAYTMPSEFIKSNMSGANVAQVRANLSIFRYCSIGGVFAKYCSYDNASLANLVNSYVSEKISADQSSKNLVDKNGNEDSIIQDIADSQGKSIEIGKVLQFKDGKINENFNNLSIDERLIVLQYLKVKEDPTYFQSLMSQSIGGQSQIIVWQVEK